MFSTYPTKNFCFLSYNHFVVCKCFQFGKEFKTLSRKPIGNIVGRDKNVRNQHFLLFPCRLLCASIVKCLTHNPWVLGSSCTGSSGLLMRVSLGKILQSPSLVLVKPRKDMSNVSCCRDTT